MLAPRDRVLVAVSGGPDSVALLHVLCDLSAELRLRLEVAHVQHGIRGEEAEEDARFVAQLVESLNFPLHLTWINLRERRAVAAKGNLEAMAREERHAFFAMVARERGLDKVAMAHTRDDQAETVLMWLLRGSGRRGLGGMAPVHPLPGYPALTIIRPLLETTKSAILEFLREKDFSYRLDRTNQDPALLRNWIRLELIPRLKQRIDPNLPSRLSQQAEIIRDEDAFLDELAHVELAKVRQGEALGRDLFLKQPGAMQRRLLRLWLGEVRGHLRGLDFGHLAAILRLISDGPPQGRVALPGGWEFMKEYGTLVLQKRSYRRNPVCYTYEYRLGSDLRIPEAGVTIHSKQMSSSDVEWPKTDMDAVFDLASLPDKLTVRNFRRGDRFRPLGMGGHQKVKDLFINKKVPRSVRSTWPLLSMGGEILWIPGFGRSEFGKIGLDTGQVWHFRAVITDAGEHLAMLI